MTAARGYDVCTPEIAHQTIDGEVVIVNLRSGFYYSLQGTAAEVWALLEDGCASPDIAAALAHRYDDPAGILESEIRRLIAELEQDEIIRPANTARLAPIKPTPLAAKQTFTPLVLHKYTDMRDLILLDPIHEVDEGGWPHSREAA